MSTPLERIILKYPDLDWSYFGIYPQISYQFIKDHFNILTYYERNPNVQLSHLSDPLPWNWSQLSLNPNITIDFVKQNLYKSWNWDHLSVILPIRDILDNLDLPWNFEYVSQNKSVTQDDLIEYSALPWDFAVLSEHIDVNFVYANPDLPWNFKALSHRMNLNFIQDNPNKNWSWFNIISRHPDITVEFILKELDDTNNWRSIWFINPNMTFKDVIENPNLNVHLPSVYEKFTSELLNNMPAFIIDYKLASLYATLEDIQKRPDRFWDYENLSSNPNITIGFIKQNLSKLWNWTALTNNININDILANPSMPWKLDLLAKNPSVTLEHIDQGLVVLNNTDHIINKL